MKVKFKKLLLKICYKLGRKQEIIQHTTRLGKIIEKEDKIVCYVDDKKLKKKQKKYICGIELKGIRNYTEKQIKQIKFFKLDKPTYYVFKNIIFDSPIKMKFYSNNAHVIFKNCTFKRNIKIDYANNIKFISNKYEDNGFSYNGYYKDEEKIFININGCNNLEIYDECITNSKEEHHPTKFGIKVRNAESIKIIDSIINIDNSVMYQGKIIIENKGEINLQSKELLIDNSVLESPEIYIESDEIYHEKSLINATNGIIIENKNNNLEYNTPKILTPYLVYNGLELIKISKNETKKAKKKEELKRARELLISTFKKVENKTINANEEILSQEREKLNRKALKRVLKREII